MALILRRRLGQEIKIGPDIAVKIVGLDADGSVRLGITAPQDYRVTREDSEPRRARCGTCARLRRQPDEAPADEPPKPTACHVRQSDR